MLKSKLLAIPAAAMFAVNPAGIDMDYQGELDPYSDLPITDTQNGDSQQTVFVSNGITYDMKTHMFSYLIPDKSGYVESSVADGMITTDSVSITLPSGLSAKIYCDGEEEADIDYSEISDPGSYALVVKGPDIQYQMLKFTIVSKKTGLISSYQIPAGFKLTKVVLNGEPQRIQSLKTVDMKAEGEYEITSRCDANGVDYRLNVEIDHTPPQIILQGVTDGKARGPVTISGITKSDYAKLSVEGKNISIPSDYTLEAPGKYHIYVQDDAGNIFSQDFEIKFYLNMQGLIFSLLAVGVAAGVFFYMYISKRKLKVR